MRIILTDISVTIPKKGKITWMMEIKEAIKQKMNLWFKLPYLPKQSNIGDRCYVVYNNRIIGYHKIVDFVHLSKGFKCEITGRDWSPGNYIVRSGFSWVKLLNPIPYNSHRSFNYFRGVCNE